jgi:hypothetical protein
MLFKTKKNKRIKDKRSQVSWEYDQNHIGIMSYICINPTKKISY